MASHFSSNTSSIQLGFVLHKNFIAVGCLTLMEGGVFVHPPQKLPVTSQRVTGNFCGGLQKPHLPCVSSFELSSILWTVDLSKHLITAWIFQKFIQFDNFVTFSVFFIFFGNRVRLNLYERAPKFRASGKRGTSVYKNVRVRIHSMQSISAIRYWVLRSKFKQ